MTVQLQALRFHCKGCALIGVLHLPAQALSRGVLIVTGGPQYRVGSHRQFVLLAHHLALKGIPVLRFDYRGMGDSEGTARDFDEAGDDLRSAVDQFFQRVPALKELVLWGLCDGATAAAFHAAHDLRVSGLVLLNPWVRTEQGAARAVLRYYYLRRLCEIEFWTKLVSGALGLRQALTSLLQLRASAGTSVGDSGGVAARGQLPQRLFQALRTFRGPMLLILSGADLTAREFTALADNDARWRVLLAAPRVRQALLPQANHTFGRAAWRDEVASLCSDWITTW
jgi:exosortase A-associated hydrolase 1